MWVGKLEFSRYTVTIQALLQSFSKHQCKSGLRKTENGENWVVHKCTIMLLRRSKKKKSFPTASNLRQITRVEIALVSVLSAICRGNGLRHTYYGLGNLHLLNCYLVTYNCIPSHFFPQRTSVCSATLETLSWE